MMVKCNVCGIEKDKSEFYAETRKCKPCYRDKQKIYYRTKADTNGILSNNERRKQSLAQIEALGYTIISEIKKDGKYQVKIRCIYCGKEVIKYRSKLIDGTSKGCGCGKSKKRTGGKYISGTYMTRLRAGARHRGHDISISVEDLESILIRQNFKCALTGRDLKFGYIPREEYTLSVDRIDSDKGYTLDNIQIVHQMVNMCKQGYDQEEFIKMCKEIAERN
jgi:hypothetical protein